MMPNNFCIFILSHGRADKIYTIDAMKKAGYSGKYYIVIDNEDKSAEQYYTNYGSKVLMFDKKEIAKTFDEADNFDDRRAIVYARNACFELAKKVGCEYFMQFDDDYTQFRVTFDNKRNYITKNIQAKQLDKYFTELLNFYINAPQITSIAISQGGDFIGGVGSKVATDYMKGKLSRKAMNSFICSTSRPFKFQGRINEDVNTYTNGANKGLLFFTYARLRLEQKQTQSNSGGMTELYLDNGTYIKSFYSVMFQPSSVTVEMMGAKNRRLHHKVKWENTIPEILSEDYKK